MLCYVSILSLLVSLLEVLYSGTIKRLYSNHESGTSNFDTSIKDIPAQCKRVISAMISPAYPIRLHVCSSHSAASNPLLEPPRNTQVANTPTAGAVEQHIRALDVAGESLAPVEQRSDCKQSTQETRPAVLLRPQAHLHGLSRLPASCKHLRPKVRQPLRTGAALLQASARGAS
jgi:hypothetical protein